MDIPLLNWIWTPSWDHTDAETPRVVYFRKNFDLKAVPEAAELRISADTRYKLYVNGRLAEVGPSRGDREVWFVDTVDIAPLLTAGRNVLAVIVLRYPAEGKAGNHAMFRTETPGLYVEGSVFDGEKELSLSADASYRTATDRGITLYAENPGFAPLIIHEKVTADPAFAGWMEADYDDSAWAAAKPYTFWEMSSAVAPGNLTPRTIPFMARRKGHFAGLLENETPDFAALLTGEGCVRIPAHTRVSAVLNAGEEMTAYLHLALGGGRGAKITLLESEAYELDEVSPTSGAPIKKDRTDCVNGHLGGDIDEYIAAGYGTKERPEVYEPFWFRTFRFIKVSVETGDEEVFIFRMDFEETGYPLEVGTHVTTPDPEFEKIWEISERTLRRCMHETYEDCPFYEQLQYIMDTRSQILYTYAAAADDRLARKAIDDFARSQRSDGLMNCSYPNMNPNVIPGFSIYYILMVHDHMMYFGDKALVRRYLPTIDRVLGFFDRNLNEEGLVGTVGGMNLVSRFWSFIDWAVEWNPTTGMPPAGLKGTITLESLLYVYGLLKAAELADWVGRRDTAEEYRERAKKVQGAIRRYSMRPDGMIADGPGLDDASQHGQVFGVLTGTLSIEEGRRNLLKTFEGGYPACTVATSFYLFRALEMTGLYEYTEKRWDIWRNMLKMNCTTCVESEDYARSECHAWGALALWELPSAILGIRPTAPGYAEAEIRPHAEFLSEASGEAVTPRGKVFISWKKTEDGVRLETEVPEGLILTKHIE